MPFHALSVVEPAGSLIRSAAKTIEVRRWTPDAFPLRDLFIIQNKIRLSSDIPEDSQGQLVAIVDVVEIRPWLPEDQKDSFSTYFEEGWLAWRLGNIREASYPHMIPAKLRIYDIQIDESLLITRSTEQGAAANP